VKLRGDDHERATYIANDPTGRRRNILTLKRHGARTLHGLRTRLACRFLALAAAVALNYRLGLSSRSLAQYIAGTLELLLI
jgi:hypothetical protein